jgi:hypothetical protein
MKVNENDQAKQKSSEEDCAEDEEEPSANNDSDQHWSCGSSTKWTTSRVLED